MYYSIKLKTIPTSPPKVFKAFWSSLFALESTYILHWFCSILHSTYFLLHTTIINIGGTYVNWILFLFEVSINNSIIQDEIRHFLKWSNFKIFRYIRFKTSLLRNKIFTIGKDYVIVREWLKILDVSMLLTQKSFKISTNKFVQHNKRQI